MLDLREPNLVRILKFVDVLLCRLDLDVVSIATTYVVVQALSPCVTAEENAVLAKVVKAMTAIEEEKCANSGICSRRRVMTQLRELGYNAALCKSRWEHAGTFPGG